MSINPEGHSTQDDSRIFKNLKINNDSILQSNAHKSQYLYERKTFENFEPLRKPETSTDSSPPKRSIVGKAGEMLLFSKNAPGNFRTNKFTEYVATSLSKENELLNGQA
jgi:hypothetical protein